MSENMLFEMKETCNFLDVFKHCSEAPDSLSSGKYPNAQIGISVQNGMGMYGVVPISRVGRSFGQKLFTGNYGIFIAVW